MFSVSVPSLRTLFSSAVPYASLYCICFMLQDVNLSYLILPTACHLLRTHVTFSG